MVSGRAGRGSGRPDAHLESLPNGQGTAHEAFGLRIPRDGGVPDLLAEACRPGRRFDAVICESIDRIARRTYYGAKIEHELEQAGVALFAADEPILLSGKRATARYDPASRRLAPMSAQAAVVQRIFTLYVARGLGSAVISGLLNDTGHATGRRCRWTPSRVLEILRNPTYTGRLPFNGQAHQAQHLPLVDAELFARAQRIVAERERSWRERAANATDYLLTRFLRCGRCGYRFVGTAAHGNGGAYRYYTCFARQRHGTKRCDQQRISADPLEEAILAEVLAALQDGTVFQEAAERARRAWQAAHPGRRAELAGVDRALAERRAAVDRYLRAFEAGRLSEATCGHRVGALEQEILALEARRASLVAECDSDPALPSGGDLAALRRQLERAIADAAPEQLKRLLDAVVERNSVESRARIQPYFFAPTVRTRTAPRGRTTKHTNTGAPGPALWVTSRAWGRAG